METSKLLWGQPDKMLEGNLRWTSKPSRGSRKNSLSLHTTETGDKRWPDGSSGSHNYEGAEIALAEAFH